MDVPRHHLCHPLRYLCLVWPTRARDADGTHHWSSCRLVWEDIWCSSVGTKCNDHAGFGSRTIDVAGCSKWPHHGCKLVERCWFTRAGSTTLPWTTFSGWHRHFDFVAQLLTSQGAYTVPVHTPHWTTNCLQWVVVPCNANDSDSSGWTGPQWEFLVNQGLGDFSYFWALPSYLWYCPNVFPASVVQPLMAWLTTGIWTWTDFRVGQTDIGWFAASFREPPTHGCRDPDGHSTLSWAIGGIFKTNVRLFG